MLSRVKKPFHVILPLGFHDIIHSTVFFTLPEAKLQILCCSVHVPEVSMSVQRAGNNRTEKLMSRALGNHKSKWKKRIGIGGLCKRK